MEKLRRKILYVAILLSVSQILALLFNFSLGGALLFGFVASAYYLFEIGEISLKELGSGVTGFTVSSFALSAAGKVLILDKLCKISRPVVETESNVSGVISTDQACRGFIENWVAVLTSNPLSSWYVWVASVGVAVLSVYAYRRYSV